jgi:hypothetical protein
MTLYAQRNPRTLEPHLSRHMEAMTAEGLHDKGNIASELAWRDAKIERLKDAIAQAADACNHFDVRTARAILLDALDKEDK